MMQDGHRTWRDRILENIKAKEFGLAIGLMEDSIQEQPSAAHANLVLRHRDRIGVFRPPTGFRLSIVRSSTVEPILPLLQAQAVLCGVDLRPWLGAFDSYSQEILAENSGLYESNPDAVVVAICGRDLVPECYSAAPRPTQVLEQCERAVEHVACLIAGLRRHHPAPIIVQNIEPPALGTVFETQQTMAPATAVRRVNRAIRTACRETPRCSMVDLFSLIADVGVSQWVDGAKWDTYRIAFGPNQIGRIADAWLAHVLPLAGRTSKVIACDLDGTLWQGAVGEDGAENILATPSGSSFRSFQQVLSGLVKQGFLLAVNSKNNPSVVQRCFEDNPDMPLKLKDFASVQLNWDSKSSNIARIAEDLNLGLDSILFLDNSRFEIEEVRSAHPGVRTLHMTGDPSRFAAMLRRLPSLQRLHVSPEDAQRHQMMANEHQRKTARQEVKTLTDYLGGLEIWVSIDAIDQTTRQRAAQLTQRTNQYTLNPHRYSETDLLALQDRPEWFVAILRGGDRIGEYGHVGLAIAEQSNQSCCVHAFLLSCRVINRGLETALLESVKTWALGKNCRDMTGHLRPTDRNVPAQRMYADHDFIHQETRDDGTEVWHTDLDDDGTQLPTWIEMRT